MSGNRLNSMTLNLDNRVAGEVVMISWEEMVQFRFKLDPQLRDALLEGENDPDIWMFNYYFMKPEDTDLLFTIMSDFRAALLHCAFF